MDKDYRNSWDDKDRLDETWQEKSFEHSENDADSTQQDDADWPPLGGQDSRCPSES